MHKTKNLTVTGSRYPAALSCHPALKGCIKTSIHDDTECPLVDCKCTGAVSCAILGCKYLWFQSDISTVEYVISPFAFPVQ
eukprot:13839148-Ditylum_brightwellii.AAC.1